MSGDVRTQALAIVREARLQVLSAIPNPEGDTVMATARVEGHSGRHVVSLAGGVVTCSAHRAEPNAQCAHAYALRLVTGGGF